MGEIAKNINYNNNNKLHDGTDFANDYGVGTIFS
jgi:hypothetical protein